MITKKVSIHQWIKLYAGPDVELHFRYAVLLNQICVCFTYGLALPILWPITLFGLINLYICEKLQFAYFYKQPETFGNELNKIGLGML